MRKLKPTDPQDLQAPDTKPKKEKPAKRGDSPEEIAKLLTQIEKAEKEVQVAEIELDAKKDEAKTAKGNWMLKVVELRTLVRTRERWAIEARRQPLLNQAKKDGAASEPKPADTPGDPEPGIGWRSTRIDKSGLFSEKAAEALELAGIRTLGGLQEAMQVGNEFWAKNSGVHGRFREQIEQTFSAFVAQQI